MSLRTGHELYSENRNKGSQRLSGKLKLRQRRCFLPSETERAAAAPLDPLLDATWPRERESPPGRQRSLAVFGLFTKIVVMYVPGHVLI